MLPVIILGIGAEARVASDIIQINDNILYGFFTLDQAASEDSLHDVSVLGTVHDPIFNELVEKDDRIDVAIADDDITNRRAFRDILKEATEKAPVNIFHPHASISTFASLGHGNLVGAGTVVSPDAQVGDMNQIGSNVVIAADAKLGNFVNVGHGCIISSSAIIEDEVSIEAGCIIASGVVIQSGAHISAGSVVTRPVNRNAKVGGKPATDK
jgi:UDP-3-O-[3-hydroxymyristoyl] glucosamine N-acyltransferase